MLICEVGGCRVVMCCFFMLDIDIIGQMLEYEGFGMLCNEFEKILISVCCYNIMWNGDFGLND